MSFKAGYQTCVGPASGQVGDAFVVGHRNDGRRNPVIMEGLTLKHNGPAIEADLIKVEVTDKNTSAKVRKKLCCRFICIDETVTIIGNNEKGEEQRLVFHTQEGLRKLEDARRSKMGLPPLH